MATKPNITKVIAKSGKALAIIMRENLATIGDDLIRQIMKKSRKLPNAQTLKAISGLTPKGVNAYRDECKTALAVVTLDALNQARKAIPKKRNVKLTEACDALELAEFDRLPKKLQNKITTQTNLIVGKQVSDLQKVIEFAYATSEEETDSEDLIESDLKDSAVGWIDSTAVESGAVLTASNMINSARQAFFFDDQVLEEIDAFEFVNGDPVTEICQDLAGTIFAKDDPGADRYFPPLHWNCKSYISPILVGKLGDRQIEKLRPSTKELEKQIQFTEDYPHCPNCH